MAKGLRSSRIKSNKRALAKKVFAPVEDARTERLSFKLQQLAAEPKPTKEAEMADVNTGICCSLSALHVFWLTLSGRSTDRGSRYWRRECATRA